MRRSWRRSRSRPTFSQKPGRTHPRNPRMVLGGNRLSRSRRLTDEACHVMLELLAEDVELPDPRLRFLAQLAVDAHVQGPHAGEEPLELLPLRDYLYVLDHALAVREGEDRTNFGGLLAAVEV